MKRSPLLFAIFLISLTLRTLEITASLNTDEGLWIYRGSQFIKHLLEGDLIGTFLKHHPGVPNMWLSGSSMWLNCWLHKLFPSLIDIDLPLNVGACLNIQEFPIPLYIIPRLAQAVITSACMVYLYILAKRLFSKAVALCTVSLLLLEPFFLAYQRFITTDALQADFAVLAILLFLLYLRKDGERKSLLLSGLFLGLATAAKITALFLLPAVALLIILIELGVWQSSFPKRGWKRQFQDFAFWVTTIVVVFILIFPAMWVSPGYVFTKIYKGVLQESDRGFLFFLGQLTHSPGILFYPLVLAYRLSPVLQAGLLATGTVLLIPKLRRQQQKVPELTALILISLCVLLILSLSDNKIDRYINLCLPVLGLLGAVGWLKIISGMKYWLGDRVPNFLIDRGLLTALTLLLLQLIFLLPHYPYYLTYYNPLLGGVKVAQNIFMIGQGEGLEKAAQWLNQSPNVKEIKVASWYSRYFATYFHGETLPIDKRISSGIQPWTQANRVVFYKNQLQRQLPEPKILNYFAMQQPLYTVRLHDVDYVWVYPGALPLAEDIKHIQFPLSLSFGEQVRLLGYDLNQTKVSTNGDLIITFYWQFLTPLPADVLLQIGWRDRFTDASGADNDNPTKFSHTFLLDGYVSPEQISRGTVLRDVHKLKISPTQSSHSYQLKAKLFSPSQEKVLGQAVIK
ncbi:glycosyltransferase family 39 protein [Halotia branconii]|uniref:Glycosyltransferase family 39 protein n=1 Tax=Halotia branconii CENA392 TaxID=1539056 RepID=A0AAJ6NN30_9CYAN|nr:glycosyltransferase family 39 protein [Halotia branconii]WGV23436.1 glycosyltransferase family 39 protein [Halotia branconii CENA392]